MEPLFFETINKTKKVWQTLLNLPVRNSRLGRPIYGTSWEGYCPENILARCRRTVRASFFRTARRVGIDLVLAQGDKKFALEFKVSATAKPQRGFWTALKDLAIKRSRIIASTAESDLPKRRPGQRHSAFYRSPGTQ
jgi:hypothetical protein